jgi:hypothetical protein
MYDAVSITINAPQETIWPILVDVERWPEWTTSIRHVERLDHGQFSVGSRARISQPSLPTLIWTVTQIEPLRSFTWVAGGPGASTVASHTLAALPDGSTGLELSIDQRGPIGNLVGLLVRGITRRYLAMESRGLKQRAESAARLVA